jgi:hypothetical protein
MRIPQTTFTGVLAATALVICATGCSSTSSPAAPSSAAASVTTAAESVSSATASGPSSSSATQAADYTGLLIQVSDIDAPIPFTAGPPTTDPNGQPGAAITFSSQPHPEDQNGMTVHQVYIRDTIRVLSDPAAAADALASAKTGQDGVVKDPKVDPVNVGNGGVTLSGKSPDGSKSETVLLFTEGRALVSLEFEGPPDPPPPPDFVIDVGQKQAAAIKKGLGG